MCGVKLSCFQVNIPVQNVAKKQKQDTRSDMKTGNLKYEINIHKGAKMKPTIRNLAKYLKKSEQTLYHMRKVQPRQWGLLWDGWLTMCENKA